MKVVLTMTALAALGAWMGVRAQDRRTPWPPPPITPPDPVSSANVEVTPAQPKRLPIHSEWPDPRTAKAGVPRALSSSVVQTQAIMPAELPAPVPVENRSPAATPSAITIPDRVQAERSPKIPPKLPAELPVQPMKTEVEVPELLTSPPSKEAPTAEPMPSGEPVLPPAPPLPPAPLPAAVATPMTPELSPLPEIIPPPAAAVPETRVTQKALDKAPSKTADAEAAPNQSVEKKKTEPPHDLVVPEPAKKETKESATAQVVAQPAPQRTAAPPIEPVPTPAPEIVAPMAPNAVPRDSTPAPIAVVPTPPATTPATVREPASPPRPPAFLLVRPRRTESAPPALSPTPLPPAAAVIETPRVPDAPLSSSAPQVTVEKHGPAVLRQGVTAAYQIIVRNRGLAASGPVTVVDDVPSLARVVTGEPAPATLGEKAIWTLPPLPPGSETVLKLELQATAGGEFVGNTTVFVSAASATTRASIQGNSQATPAPSGPLAMQVSGPSTATVGQSIVFEVKLTNQGRQTLTRMLLGAKLGEGLSHPAGNNIEADIGDVAPGESKTFKMPVTAVRAGKQSVDLKITAAGGAEAQARMSVTVTSGGLSLQLAPISRLDLNHEGEIRIEVTNLQAEGLRNVVVADTLPESMRFITASDRGIYQAGTRTVQWLIDILPGGETRTVSVRVQPTAPGQFNKEVSARAESLPETRAHGVVHVEGYANLVIKMTPRDHPMEIGKETLCEVRVQNLGNLPASGVALQVELPPGLAAGSVQGPTAHRLQGQTMLFDRLATLPARTQAVYHIHLMSQATGDWRIRAQVVSDQAHTPVLRETPISVYRE
jgi:uncharacterized repeat protein (TIGR01451 family)